MKKQFNNTTNTKEGTDEQKLKKTKMGYDVRFWKTVRLNSFQINLILLVCVLYYNPQETIVCNDDYGFVI